MQRAKASLTTGQERKMKKSLKEKSADFSVSRQQMNRDFSSSSCRPRAHIASLLILKFIFCLYYIPHGVFLLLHQLQKCNVIFALFLGAPTIQTFSFAVIAIVLRMKSEWERVMRYNRRVSVAYMLMWYLGKERLFTSWVRFSLIFPFFSPKWKRYDFVCAAQRAKDNFHPKKMQCTQQQWVVVRPCTLILEFVVA